MHSSYNKYITVHIPIYHYEPWFASKDEFAQYSHYKN